MIIKIENGWSGDITFSFSIAGAMIQNRLQWLWVRFDTFNISVFRCTHSQKKHLSVYDYGALKHMSMIEITICSFLPPFIFLLLYFHRCLCLQIALIRSYKIVITCDVYRIFRKLNIISHIFKQKSLDNETAMYACN